MSSKDPNNLIIDSSDNALIAQIQEFVKAKQIIIPFAEDRFSCQALKAAENLVYLDLNDHQEIEEYSSIDRTITVQCGIKVKELNDFLLERERWFPLTYCDNQTSLLELILTDYHGPYESLFGGLCKHLLGLRAILSSGQIIKAGGKVVKNVSGYDLTRFLINSWGCLALPITAHLRLYSLPKEFLTISVPANDCADLIRLASELASQQMPLAYMDIVDNFLLRRASAGIPCPLSEPYSLVLQIYGQPASVEQSAKVVQDASASYGLSFQSIKDNDQQFEFLKCLTQLNRYSDTNNLNLPKKTVTVLANFKECSDLLAHKELSAFPFLYRPLAQKFYYCLDSDLQQTKLLNILTDYAMLNAKTIPVTYGDNNYLRTLTQLGSSVTENEIVLDTIKDNLKKKFDPSRSFNPFAKI